MQNIQAKKSYTSSWVVLFLLLGSQLFSYVSTITGISQQIFAILNAGITVLVFFILLLNNKNILNKNLSISFAFILFFLLYNLRMFRDLYLNNIYTDTFANPNTYFFYLYLLCFIPALSIYILRNVNFDKVLKYVFYSFFIMCSLGLFFNFIGTINSSVDSELRSQATNSIGSLGFGHYGVSLSILSVYLIKYGKLHQFKFKYIVLILSLIIGLITIYVSGSRSPLLALFIILTIILFGIKKPLKYILIGVVVYSLYNEFKTEIATFFLNYGGNLGYRINRTIMENYTSGRDILLEYAFIQISDNPFFGSSFLLTGIGDFRGYYPHNLLIEILLAVGIFGFYFFIYYLGGIFKNIYIHLKKYGNKHSWIFFIFFQYFLFGMVSKSLYTNTLLWMFGALSLNYLLNYKKNIYVSK